MKKNIIKTFALCLLASILAGCEDARYAVVENIVYISDAYNAKTKDITMQEGTTKTSIIVRLAQKAETDVTVELATDESYLEQYNSLNQTDLKLVPEAIFDKTVTIPAGEVSSAPVVVEIPYFETLGASYALPLVITNVNGGIEKGDNSSKLIINLVKPIHQFVPKFTYNNGMQADPQENWNLSLDNYTLEWWSRMTGRYNENGGYSVNNQAIFNSGSGSTEFYIRFGDLIYASGSKYQNNFLQMKTMGTQFDSGDPTKEGNGLTSGVWYHWAITYDSATGKCIMYKNGAQVSELSVAAGQPMIIEKFQMISSGAQYFPDNCEMCQVRFWKTTRSAAQIQKYMYSEVAYDNEDLIMYLPMNEGEGSVLNDVTGNGHNVTIGNLESSYTHENVTWAEYTFAK